MLKNESIYEKVSDMKLKGIPFVLATVVRAESPTSAKPGAKAIIHAKGLIDGWVGGGCAQPAVISAAKEAFKDGQPRLIRVSPTKNEEGEKGIVDFGMTCHSGGTLDIFIEPVVARPMLLIIGASPAAQALSRLATRSGFNVTAVFPGANEEMFPDAQQIVDGLDTSFSSPPPFVVVATQGKRDEPSLEAALGSGSPYIAFIASAKKAKKLRTYLKERGHNPLRVAAIDSPAGVEIGAVTPEEIALSVLAALVKIRRDGGIENISESQETSISEKSVDLKIYNLDTADSDQAATAIDPVCKMQVDVPTAEFKSVHHAHNYYFCCGACQHLFEKTPAQFLSA